MVDHCLGDQTKEDEMGRECGMYADKENYTQIFGWQT